MSLLASDYYGWYVETAFADGQELWQARAGVKGQVLDERPGL